MTHCKLKWITSNTKRTKRLNRCFKQFFETKFYNCLHIITRKKMDSLYYVYYVPIPSIHLSSAGGKEDIEKHKRNLETNCSLQPTRKYHRDSITGCSTPSGKIEPILTWNGNLSIRTENETATRKGKSNQRRRSKKIRQVWLSVAYYKKRIARSKHRTSQNAFSGQSIFVSDS